MQWFPFVTRERTEEEKKSNAKHSDEGLFINPPIPQDGQTVLVTVRGRVEIDTFHTFPDGYCYFMSNRLEEVTAWMEFPEPYEAKNVNNR